VDTAEFGLALWPAEVTDAEREPAGTGTR
jgi:hypothetical protein